MADEGGGEVPRERPNTRDRRRGGRSRVKSALSTEDSTPSIPVTEEPASGSVTEIKAAEKVPVVPLLWREAAWFASGHGDLWFAQWLLGRCQGLRDVTTPSKADVVERVFRLHELQKRLRAELAAGSPSASPKTATEPWSMQAVVCDVLAELRPQREESRGRGPCERAMTSELMELTTEVLLCHADADDLDALKEWVEWLCHDPDRTEEDAQQPSNQVGATMSQQEQDAAEVEGTKVKKPRRKKERLTPESLAAKQVMDFMAFLTAKHEDTSTCLKKASNSANAHALWQQEVKSIYDELCIDLQEETRRLGVVNQLQQIIRRDGRRWRNVQLSLFGSSLSRYGSKSSDVDMCLIFPTSTNDEPTKQLTVSARQLKAMSKPSVIAQEHAHDTALLLELRDQVLKSKQKVTLMAQEMKEAKAKNLQKQAKQLNALNFFADNLALLYNAISDQLGDDAKHEHNHDNYHKPSEEFKALLAQSKRRSDDLYRLRALLQRAKCDIRYVLSGARIPIIRFMHTPSGMDCDLCFDNVLATRNTRLLRAYATLDDRARMLGMAVKYWAKQRAISDASLGYLSSYSFVLLTIYFLQRVARILPNLQHPQLLVDAKVRPDYHDDIDIAFCTDLTMARSFHLSSGGSADASLDISSLLLGFFKFYATCFDFAHHVVTIRHPELDQMEKRSRWGRGKTKSWRLSIEDPLETTRDLGCVLQFQAQQQIFDEFQRAHELLSGGESFSSSICDPAKPAGKKTQKSTKPTAKERALNGAMGKPQQERKRSPKQDAAAVGDGVPPSTDTAALRGGVSVDANTSEAPKQSENGEQSSARSKRTRDPKRGRRGNEQSHAPMGEPKEAHSALNESKATSNDTKVPTSKSKRSDSNVKKENSSNSKHKRESKRRQQKPDDTVNQDSSPPVPVAP